MKIEDKDGGQVVTDIADLFADSKCAICGDTGHFIVDDTGPEYVTSPCPECNAPAAKDAEKDAEIDALKGARNQYWDDWNEAASNLIEMTRERDELRAQITDQHLRTVAAKDAEIARLEKECTALAASACDGVVGDDYGHSFCRYKKELEQLRALLGKEGQE